MEGLRKEDGVLILENRYGVEHLLHHIHLIYVAQQTKAIEHGHKDMCHIELKKDVFSLGVCFIYIKRFTIFIHSKNVECYPTSQKECHVELEMS